METLARCSGDREDLRHGARLRQTEAGDMSLTTGQIMQAIRTRGQTLVITDVDAHAMRYLGCLRLWIRACRTSCGAVSARLQPMLTLNFLDGSRWVHRFDGNSVQEIPCEVRDYIFDGFNTGQQSVPYANLSFQRLVVLRVKRQ